MDVFMFLLKTCVGLGFLLLMILESYDRGTLILTPSSEQTVLSGGMMLSRLLITFLVCSSLMILSSLIFALLALFEPLPSGLLILHMMLMA